MFNRLNKITVLKIGLFLMLLELFCVSYVFSDLNHDTSTNIIKTDSSPIEYADLSIESIGKAVGSLNHDIISASVVDLNIDGLYGIVYLLPSGIYIAPYKQVAKPFFYRFSGFGTPVSFSVSPDSQWFVVNILIPDVGLASCLLHFDGNSLLLVQDNINMWLDFLNDGTMIARKFDIKNKIGNVFFIIKPSDNGIVFVNEKPIIPTNAVINLFAFVDLNNNDIKEMVFVDKSGVLNVYESNKQIWSKKVISINDTVSFLNIKTAVIDSPTINNKSFWLAFNESQQQPSDKIFILKLFSNNGNYSIKSVSIKINGRISGFNVMNGKIILIVADISDGVSKSGVTKIYEIEESRI